MASRVDVSNLALTKLGEDYKLTDPADPVKAAREIAACWDMVRTQVLRDNPWNFATARFALPALANVAADAIWPYSNAFQTPEAMLRFIEILDPDLDAERWQVEGGRILADTAGPLRIRCVVDVPQVELWDPLAVETLAAALAFQIADTITGDESRKNGARADRKMAIAEAKGIDAIENPPITYEEDDWILARFR